MFSSSTTPKKNSTPWEPSILTFSPSSPYARNEQSEIFILFFSSINIYGKPFGEIPIDKFMWKIILKYILYPLTKTCGNNVTDTSRFKSSRI